MTHVSRYDSPEQLILFKADGKHKPRQTTKTQMCLQNLMNQQKITNEWDWR